MIEILLAFRRKLQKYFNGELYYRISKHYCICRTHTIQPIWHINSETLFSLFFCISSFFGKIRHEYFSQIMQRKSDVCQVTISQTLRFSLILSLYMYNGTTIINHRYVTKNILFLGVRCVRIVCGVNLRDRGYI